MQLDPQQAANAANAIMTAFGAAVVLAIVIAPLIYARDKITAQANARKMADMRWYVKDVYATDSGGMLTLYSEGKDRIEAKLFVRPFHPDLPLVRTLGYLDIIEFDFAETPLDRAPDIEICAYLRIRRVGSFA